MRVADADGHRWPVTGATCPICRMPTDPELDGGPHPGCCKPRRALNRERHRAVLDQLREQLGTQTIDQWRISGEAVHTHTPPYTNTSTDPGARQCTDCGQLLPEHAGVGVLNHLSCWQNRRRASKEHP